MQYKLTFFLLSFFFVQIYVEGQRLPTRIAEIGYNATIGEWQIINEDLFTYQGVELREQSNTKFRLQNDSLTLSEYHLSKYDIYGRLVLVVDSLVGFQDVISVFRKEYFYENELIHKERWTASFSGTIESIRETLFFYNNENQLILEETFKDDEDNNLILEESNEYTYDEKGCLTSKKTHIIEESEILLEIFERAENCDLIGISHFKKLTTDSDFSPHRLIKYTSFTYNNHQYQIDSTFYFDSTLPVSGWKYYHTTALIYDEHNQLIERIYNNISGVAREYFWIYDDFQRLSRYEEYSYSVSSDSFVFRKLIEYKYTLDENGHVIELTIDTYNPSINKHENTEFFKYENFCDGTLSVASDEIFHNAVIPTIKTTYEYLNGVDCDFKNEKQPLEISPNPSNGIFKIKGDLLGGASTKIKVLNFVGQLLFEIKVPEQSYIYDLDLSHLNNGNYVIFIENGDYYSTEKITIFK